MSTLTQDSPITQKTRELCQAILDQPESQALRRNIEAFMADDQARGLYDALMMKGQMLQQKQQAGMQLAPAEITEFEKLRDEFESNPVGRSFVDAQMNLEKVQRSVATYVSKALELGRVPEESDLDSGSCGSGCGCHH